MARERVRNPKQKTLSNHFEEIRPVGLMGGVALATLIPIGGVTVPAWFALATVATVSMVKISTIYKYINEGQKRDLFRNHELLNLAMDLAIAGAVYQLGVMSLANTAVASAMPAATALISYCGFKLLFNGMNSPLDHLKSYMTGDNELIDNTSHERSDLFSALRTNAVESATTLFYSSFGAGTRTTLTIPLVGYTLPVLDKVWAGVSLFGISSAAYRGHAAHTHDSSIAVKEIVKNLITAAGGAILATFSEAYVVPIIAGGVAARVTSGGDLSYAEQLLGAQKGEQKQGPEQQHDR